MPQTFQNLELCNKEAPTICVKFFGRNIFKFFFVITDFQIEIYWPFECFVVFCVSWNGGLKMRPVGHCKIIYTPMYHSLCFSCCQKNFWWVSSEKKVQRFRTKFNSLNFCQVLEAVRLHSKSRCTILLFFKSFWRVSSSELWLSMFILCF